MLTGDAADEELLLEENIDSADAFVAVTNAANCSVTRVVNEWVAKSARMFTTTGNRCRAPS